MMRSGPGGMGQQDSTAMQIGGMFHECSDGQGVTLCNFLHFLAHVRMLRWDFDHIMAVSIFMEMSSVDPLDVEEKEDQEPVRLDQKEFKNALQAVAIHIYGAAHGIVQKPVAAQGLEDDGKRRESRTINQGTGSFSSLQDMLRDLRLNNEVPFSLRSVSEMATPLYDVDVLAAVYEYDKALRKLWSHFAVEINGGLGVEAERSVNARSAYRLCRASRLVPHWLVAGELHDVAMELRGLVRHTESRWWQDEKMLQRGESPDWLQPARTTVPGEPRYGYPEIVELLMASAFHAPPRVHRASQEERIARIHDVFGGLLSLPKLEMADAFDCGHYLQQLAACQAEGSPEQKTSPSSNAAAADSFALILVELDTHLPLLPPRQEPNIPKPNPATLASLPPQPPTFEERLANVRRDGGGKAGKAKGKKKKGSKKKQQVDSDRGPIVFDKVQFLGKRPEKLEPVIPLMFQRESKVAQLKLLDDHIKAQSDQADTINTPTSGWVLRMQLIDEPLRAPECHKSEEVLTLIETALTSRRLRHYDTAIWLLIKARRLWAAVEAGHNSPPSWSNVPSPWISGHGMGSPPSSVRQPRYAPANVQEGQGGVLQSALVMIDDPIKSKAPLADQALDATIQPGEMQRKYSSGSQTARVMASRQGSGSVRSLPESVEGGSTSSRTGVRGQASSPLHPPPVFSGSDAQQQQQYKTRPSRAGSHISTLMSARGRSPTSYEATQNRLAEKRYDPKKDFDSAAGDEEADLECLPPEAALFFFCELASLHSALHEDDLAARLLWRAQVPSQKLERRNKHDANAAVVWCGLGRVAFHTSNFELAARLHMRARSIRERILGGDTVDTATSYNNLACCLAALDRPLEALAFVELASEILKELAGEDHPRTQTTLRNLEKARTAPKHITIEMPHLFSFPTKPVILGRKGRRKKKGKSKGGSKSSRASSKSSKGKK